MNRTRTSKNAKRLLVWLLLLTMVFGLLPMAAFADETVVEPVVSEEPVQEPTEPSSEPTEPSKPTEAPSEPSEEPTQKPENIPEPEQPGDADVIIEGDEEQPEDEGNDEVILDDYWLYPQPMGISELASTNGFMKIFFLDCGRKYFSVDNIKKLIDNASAAGFNYIQLAVGNDGLRFLLNDMSLTVNGTPYTTEQVSNAIKTGNANYYNFPVNELTQPEMDTIIAYATEKKMGVIPCVNTPGHMDAILSAATALTGTNCSYNGSARTIDVTNATAVAFTQALLQKYISYFAGKGCQFFNMGADEYANDIYTEGSMGFGELTRLGQYKYYIQYVNQVAAKVREAGMYPMMFNDGVYFNGDTLSGTFNKSIIVCYWSSGWGGYSSMKPTDLVKNGYKVVNTHGDYYWVLGKGQCTAEKASQFKIREFMADTLNEDPSGAMFCIWCDYPNAEKEADVVSKTEPVIKAFGKTLPNPPTTGGGESGGGGTTEPEKPDPANKTINLKVGDTATETVDGSYADVTTDDSNIAKVDPKVSDKPGTGTYTKVSKGEGTFFVSKNSAVTAEPPVTLTFEDAGNGMYYIKNGNEYVYPKWTYDWGSKYSVKSGKKEVDVNTLGKDGGYTISCSYTGSLSGSTYTAYLSYDNNGNLTAQSSHAKLYLYTKTDLEKQTTLTFTGVAPGTTYCTVGDTKYKIVVDYKQENISAYVGGTKTVENVSGKLDTNGLDTGVATVTLAGNVLTITGVSEGNTSVIVGNTKYTIVVTKEDLTKVTPLELEYWITNGRVTVSDTDTTNYASVPATAEGVATDMGIDVSSVTIDKGRKEKRDVYYWRCRLLDTSLENNSKSGTERQTEESGDDDTTNGIGFTRIRYYNGVWSVFTENSEWINVESKHQLVAYYREYIKVTDEVESYAADWGKKGDGSTSGDYLEPKNVNTISYQVVYQDGNSNPAGTTADDLKSKTICYGYWAAGRGIGTIMLDETSNYEIYKVTAETGAMKGDGETWGSYTVSEFTWDDNETTVWTEADGKASDRSVIIQNNSNYPSKEGFYENLQWDEDYESILIRIYVRAKVTRDSLTVHYVDKSTNTDFYSYNIVVANETYFDPQFAKVGNELTGNTVKNIDNQTQTVQSDITKMPEIGAQYRFAIYTFDDAKRSEDGKEVFLYYTFTRSKTFVIDFGLPLVIQPEDLNTELKGANIMTTEATDSTSYATITVADKAVKYALKETLDKNDIFWIKYTGKNLTTSNVGEIKFTVEIIPASNVYYEDGFAKFVSGKNTASGAKWEVVGNETSVSQALSELGDKNIYGYDAAYINSTEYSMGSAHKVTVTSAMRNGWTSLSAWPTATFSFKGTGFDVISLTNNTSGAILVDVYDSNGNKVKGYFVDNYFGYGKNDVGEWVKMPDGGDNILYQIPVIKVSDLTYDNYNVTITVFYNDAFEHNEDSSYDFWLDAIRVYEPLGPSGNDSYKVDGEGYPQYIRLHDEIVKEGSSVGTSALFIEGEKEADVAKYTNLGPNNEVYLANGQAISFKLSTNDKIDKVQIGAKAPTGTTGMTVNKNTESKVEITSATEMYYDITTVAKEGQVTITNNTGNILSLTNIKVTFSEESEVTLVALDDAAKENAVEIVRTLFAAPVVEPEKTFEPSHFKATWSKNVRAGERAVLTVKTSEDVESITVNGVPVTTYKTRTERTGWGRNAQRVTYREFTYMISAAQNADYTVIAVNAEGTSSAPQIASLNVIPARPTRPGWGWLKDLFGRWF